MIKDKIELEGEYDASDVRQALDHPETVNVVQRNIKEEKLRLVDKERNGPVFKTQMSLIGERNMSPDGRFKEDDHDFDPEEAHLDADESAVNEVAQTVTNLIRSNTLERQQQQAAQ